MKSLKIFKKIAVACVAVALVSIMFSSCHRGHGCPGKITNNPDIEVEQTC